MQLQQAQMGAVAAGAGGVMMGSNGKMNPQVLHMNNASPANSNNNSMSLTGKNAEMEA